MFLAKSYLHILASKHVTNPGLCREKAFGMLAQTTSVLRNRTTVSRASGTQHSQTGDALGRGNAVEVGFEEVSIAFLTPFFLRIDRRPQHLQHSCSDSLSYYPKAKTCCPSQTPRPTRKQDMFAWTVWKLPNA